MSEKYDNKGGVNDDIGLLLNENYFNEEVKSEDDEKKSEEDEPKKEKKLSLFETEMKFLGMTKVDILDMITNLSNDGFVSEKGSLLNGTITYEFRSTKISQASEMVSIYERRKFKTEIAAKDFFVIHTFAGFLHSYNGEELPEGLSERVKYIEDNIHGVVFGALRKRNVLFSRKVDLLSYEEVDELF